MTSAYIEAPTLASRGIPYNAKGINIKTFGVKELGLISKTIIAKTLEYQIEALGNCIDVDVNSLTIGDFYQLIAWQRFTAYDKVPPIGDWTCAGTMYRLSDGTLMNYQSIKSIVSSWENAGEETRQKLIDPNTINVVEETCGQHNEEKLYFSDFQLIQLPESPQLDPRLDYPRVSVLQSLIDCLSDPSQVFICPAAQWIKAGTTIQEKIQILEAEPNLELFDLAAEANIKYTHGISEVTTKTCSNCGAETSLKFKIVPEIFFRLI